MTPSVDLNRLVRFAERRDLVSACVPSHFKRLLTPYTGIPWVPVLPFLTDFTDLHHCYRVKAGVILYASTAPLPILYSSLPIIIPTSDAISSSYQEHVELKYETQKFLVALPLLCNT